MRGRKGKEEGGKKNRETLASYRNSTRRCFYARTTGRPYCMLLLSLISKICPTLFTCNGAIFLVLLVRFQLESRFKTSCFFAIQ